VDKKIGALGLIMTLFSLPAGASSAGPAWAKKLEEEVRLASRSGGELGLYVKELSSGEVFSAGGERSWYLASGVKVPVAIELLRRTERGALSLEESVQLKESDFIDGTGETNFQKPGAKLKLGYLLEQMIIHSDNTATDLLLRKLGLAQVNSLVESLVPEGFGKITTLADVRRHAYSGLHPQAMELANSDLRRVGEVRGDSERIRILASLLPIDPEEADLGASFAAYYAGGLNSGTLLSMCELLRKLTEGEALGSLGTKKLLGIMERVETGRRRIKAGLGPEFVWAHKTGTQYERACDFGIAWRRSDPDRKVIVAACASGFATTAKAEAALRRLGRSMRDIFPRP
jgi:beta-lactamase class A